jgi:hypothetical protein
LQNSKKIIGYSPNELFEKGNFYDILPEEQAQNLAEHLDFVQEEHDDESQADGPEVLSFVVTGPDAVQIKLWCALHLSESNKDLLICEFELENDAKYPLAPPTDETTVPTDTLSSNPTPEEYLESTMNSSRPLRLLRSVRRRRGDAAAMEVCGSFVCGRLELTVHEDI